MLVRTQRMVTGALILSLGVVSIRYLHSIEPISICRFQDGMCAEGDPVYLAEGRLNVSSITTTSTGASSNTVIQPATGSLTLSGQPSLIDIRVK